MAEIRNGQMKVEVGEPRHFNFIVTYDVHFSRAERELNLEFTEKVTVLEQDADLDYYFQIVGDHHWPPSSYPPMLSPDVLRERDRPARSSLDDFVVNVVDEGRLRPEGMEVVTREHTATAEYTGPERTLKFFALMRVIPEIHAAADWIHPVEAPNWP